MRTIVVVAAHNRSVSDLYRRLNQSYLDELGITYMPGWKDPWGERPMTFGEVGCFLSHYFIWQKVNFCGV